MQLYALYFSLINCQLTEVFVLHISIQNIYSVSKLSIYPSIFYTRLIRRLCRRGAGAYPSGRRARGGVHPGQVASPSQGHTETNETNTLTLAPRDNLESPINITCMFLDGGRKPEYPVRTHTYTGRTCKLHTERPRAGVEPGDDGANHNSKLCLKNYSNRFFLFFFINLQYIM